MNRLWMALLMLALPATANPLLTYGRLEHRPSHCRIVVKGRPLACQRLQLSANGSGGLRLRFIGDDEETGGSYQLSFVSLDGDQSSPLSCERSACRLDRRSWSAPLLSTQPTQPPPGERGVCKNLLRVFSWGVACQASYRRKEKENLRGMTSSEN